MKLKNFQRSLGIRIRIVQAFWLIVSVLFFTTYFPWPSLLKANLLRLFGARVGRNLVLRPNVYIKCPWNLKLGEHVWIGYSVHIDNDELVSVGSSTCLSQHSKIFTGSHDFGDEQFTYIGKPVTVGNDCWIAACAILMPGTAVKDGTFIKAGDFVK